jgi:CRISPR-associated protein Cas2
VALTVIIAYDVASDRNRARVAAQLQRVGNRIQKSVFECITDPATLTVLITTLTSMIDLHTDTIHAIPVCRECHDDVERIGQARTVLDKPFWIV